MKKLVSVLLILLIAVSMAFGYQNTYSLSSNEVQTFLLLRKTAGSATPDPTFPISESQLKELLESLDTGKFNVFEKKLYDNLLNRIEDRKVIIKGKNSGINTSISVLGLQKYQHSGYNEYTIIPFKDLMPMFNVLGEVYYSDYVYGNFNYNGLPYYTELREKNSYSYLVTDIGAASANSFPDKAYFSLGYKGLNLFLGRDRLGAGNGYTGNLELGENSYYEDFGKLSVVTDKFSYDFVLSSFVQETQTTSTQKRNKKTLYIHRASFDLFDKVSLSVFEGALNYGETPFTDLRLFNPFMIIHQTFMFTDGSQNNFFGFEMTAQLPDHFQFDAQAFIDQVFLDGESENSGDNAYMVMGNISRSQILGNGFLDLYLEGVYGNPYTYLKNTKGQGFNPETGYLNDGSGRLVKDFVNHVDLVMDPYVIWNIDDSKDPQYLGYKYGANLWSVALGASYRSQNFELALNLQYLSKGKYGIRAGEERVCEGFEGDKNINQNTFLAQAELDWLLFKGIEIKARVAFMNHMNYQHVLNVMKNDSQYYIGINIHPLELLNIGNSL